MESPRMPTASMRLVPYFHKFRLDWILVPLSIVEGIHWAFPGKDVSTRLRDHLLQAVNLYEQASGKGHDASLKDVYHIVSQLSWTDHAARHSPSTEAVTPESLVQSRLDSAVNTLLRFYISGQQPNDEFFNETQAAYSEYDGALQRVTRFIPSPFKSEVRSSVSLADARIRCIDAWRHWFDHRENVA
jgi:hypothetical protein